MCATEERAPHVRIYRACASVAPVAWRCRPWQASPRGRARRGPACGASSAGPPSTRSAAPPAARAAVVRVGRARVWSRRERVAGEGQRGWDSVGVWCVLVRSRWASLVAGSERRGVRVGGWGEERKRRRHVNVQPFDGHAERRDAEIIPVGIGAVLDHFEHCGGNTAAVSTHKIGAHGRRQHPLGGGAAASERALGQRQRTSHVLLLLHALQEWHGLCAREVGRYGRRGCERGGRCTHIAH